MDGDASAQGLAGACHAGRLVVRDLPTYGSPEKVC